MSIIWSYPFLMIAKKDILVSICISCSIFKLFIIFVWKWAFTLSLSFIYVYILEKEMATHSSTLAWKILWTEEPGGISVFNRVYMIPRDLNHPKDVFTQNMKNISKHLTHVFGFYFWKQVHISLWKNAV